MSQANSAIAHRWFKELWTDGDINVIDELAAPDAIGHGQIEEDGQINLEQFRALFRNIRNAFPDIQFTIEQTVAADDMVSCDGELSQPIQESFSEHRRRGAGLNSPA